MANPDVKEVTDVPIDFDAAETFLRQAREAYAVGDMILCAAARKLVAVALCLGDNLGPRFKTGHLR